MYVYVCVIVTGLKDREVLEFCGMIHKSQFACPEKLAKIYMPRLYL